MNLTEFYESIDALVDDLHASGFDDDAQSVEDAMRGGATSGEVLGRLSVALSAVHAPAFQERVSIALRFIDGTLSPPA